MISPILWDIFTEIFVFDVGAKFLLNNAVAYKPNLGIPAF